MQLSAWSSSLTSNPISLRPQILFNLEFDPLTQEPVWAYEGSEDNGFYTELCGSSQRLPNGNTLITESEAGRAFEVTADLGIVWEYVSPFRAGPEDEYVATLLEVVRLPEDTPTDWIPVE